MIVINNIEMIRKIGYFNHGGDGSLSRLTIWTGARRREEFHEFYIPIKFVGLYLKFNGV